jgi:hypothetical protein
MQNIMDVTVAVGSTARWTVTFDHGSKLMQVAQGDRDSLAAGLRKLFTESTEENLCLLERGFAVGNRPPTSLLKLWEILLRQDCTIAEYFEGAIPLVEGREWCSVIDDALRRWIGVATHHTGIFRPRLDVIYMMPRGHLSALMRERPFGFTIHGFVYQGSVSVKCACMLCEYKCCMLVCLMLSAAC